MGDKSPKATQKQAAQKQAKAAATKQKGSAFVAAKQAAKPKKKKTKAASFVPAIEKPRCLFGLAQLGQFIPETLNLKLEIDVAGGLVVKVAVVSPFVPV